MRIKVEPVLPGKEATVFELIPWKESEASDKTPDRSFLQQFIRGDRELYDRFISRFLDASGSGGWMARRLMMYNTLTQIMNYTARIKCGRSEVKLRMRGDNSLEIFDYLDGDTATELEVCWDDEGGTYELDRLTRYAPKSGRSEFLPKHTLELLFGPDYYKPLMAQYRKLRGLFEQARADMELYVKRTVLEIVHGGQQEVISQLATELANGADPQEIADRLKGLAVADVAAQTIVSLDYGWQSELTNLDKPEELNVEEDD